MELTVINTEQYVRTNEKRMPFQFGNVVTEKGAHHVLDLELEVDGESASGISMVGIAPLWFLKDPDLALPEQNERLLEVFDAACSHALELDGAPTVFDLWYDLYDRMCAWATDTPHPPLLWGYGVSMVEQAVIDAFCRHRGISFGEAIRTGEFGVRPGTIYSELEGSAPADYLPDEPTGRAAVRHTVGLSDPLVAAEMDPENRLEDGLPQALDEYVERHGVDHFKIKLSADEEQDAARLARIGSVLEESALESWFCTVDANEQYESVRTFKTQWERHVNDQSLAPVVDAVAYVEQPLPREKALTAETSNVLTAWDERPAIIIDESDNRLDSAGRALEHGYAGTSHKNCKGVFKGIVNACLVEHRRRMDDDREYLISGEDLTTIGPVELLQDLAVMGTLGLDHVERNGHHYYRGLSFLPDDLQEAMLENHGDLYARHEAGFAALDVESGRLRFDSVVDAPFGRGFELDPERFTALEEWTMRSIYE